LLLKPPLRRFFCANSVGFFPRTLLLLRLVKPSTERFLP